MFYCLVMGHFPHLATGLTVVQTGCSRELGSASTWSLDRLDALAAEASALFKHRARLGMPPRELKSQAMDLQPKPNRKARSLNTLSVVSLCEGHCLNVKCELSARATGHNVAEPATKAITVAFQPASCSLTRNPAHVLHS